MRVADAWRATALLAAWPCLAAGLLLAPRAWRCRRQPAGCTALLLLASAWLYALPLALLAPAAELRYLGWPCVASLAAFVIALAGGRPARHLANP
jgi:peptidoglycan/LPS O-acetylase OafA/YrhL